MVSDRERLVRTLYIVQAGFRQRCNEIERYLSWVEEQEAKMPPSPAIRTSTRWSDDVCWLDRVVKFINYRSDILRRHGWNLDATWTMDTKHAIAEALQPPRGMETAVVIFKNAVIEVEAYLRFVLHTLGDIEENQVWGRMKDFLEVCGDCLTRETLPGFLKWVEGQSEMIELRDMLESELSRDAVWLLDSRTRMHELEIEVEDDGEWERLVSGHERIMLELLEEAEGLGMKIGMRQTLITEYFSKT